jgi:hypothetical protein
VSSRVGSSVMPKRFFRTPDAGSRYGSWLEYLDIPEPGVHVADGFGYRNLSPRDAP